MHAQTRSSLLRRSGRAAGLAGALLALLIGGARAYGAGAAARSVSLDTASPARLRAFFGYPRRPTSFTVSLIEERKDYRVYAVSWESWAKSPYGGSNRVPAYYYQPRAAGRAPGVVMLHMWLASHLRPERAFCAHLARHGIACLLPTLPLHGARTPAGEISGDLFITSDISATLRTARQAVIDVRTAADFLAGRPEVDATRLGVVGISLGAVLANLVMGVDERFTAGVSIVGGADLAGLIWSGSILTGVRAGLEREGVTLDDLRRRLRVIEPLTYAEFNRPRRVLMINGRYDTVISPAATLATWRALGEPSIIWLEVGHFSLVLVPSQMLNATTEYLLSAFALNDPAAPGAIASETLSGGSLAELPRIKAYTVKAMLLWDDDAGVSGGVALVAAKPWPKGSLNLGLTTSGPLVSVAHTIRPDVDLGLGAWVRDGHLRAEPYVALTLML